MAKFSKKQREAAQGFLANPPGLGAHTSDREGLSIHSSYLLEQLKAKVVLDEFRQDAQQNDLLTARQGLTPADFAEFQKFRGEES
jgi:hypothetical protein